MTDVDTSSRKILPLSNLPERSSQSTMATRSRDTGPAVPDLPNRASNSPRGTMTRKRAASINTEEANHPRIENLSLNTQGSSSPLSPDNTKDHICLCTPAPKVPRPRNAFILYRQHHQAQVVGQNPGLANPEISKIIGEQWRDAPEARKDQWRRLAEEEKQRHQRQYPDYRYQPRRGGKGGASRPASAAGEDPGRCPKCGGRYIATPRTPSTPFIPTTAGRGNMPPYTNPNPRVIETDHLRHPSQSGKSMAVEHGRGGRGSYPTAGHHHLQGIHEEYEMMSPSDNKRRRFNVSGGYQGMPSPDPYSAHGPPRHRQPSLGGPPIGSPSYGHGPGNSLPGPSMLNRAGPSMGPPPSRSSISSYHHHLNQGRGSSFDDSLRLPPLQTQLPTTSHESSGGPSGGPATATATAQPSLGARASTGSSQSVGSLRESQARSIEAMVMSIPYINKLKVLEKVSPPLAPPSPSSPVVETRGAVIAVEGTNPALLRQVATLVERALMGSGECAVRVWASDEGATAAEEPALDSDSRGGRANSGGARGTADKARADSVGGASLRGSGELFSSYLRTMADWHAKSAEMVKHITTSPPVGRSSDASSASAATTSSSSAESGGGSSDNSGGGGPSGSQRKSDAEGAGSTANPAAPSSPPRHSRIPVALVTGGFNLTTSDRFACLVPIADSYAPVDHWQWMATLWRGIVGPDLVVYVRSASDDELGKLQAVELKAPGIMMVRVHEGTGIVEKTERRLGFEIVEWVRAGTFKEGF